jgi:ubiquitin-conjugating enzyme E2 Z
MSIDLEEENPFVWNVIIFGPKSSYFEGGMFPARIVFNEQFPDVFPRAKFAVDVFHPNITKDGVPYYTVAKADDVRQHLTALYKLFENEPDK